MDGGGEPCDLRADRTARRCGGAGGSLKNSQEVVCISLDGVDGPRSRHGCATTWSSVNATMRGAVHHADCHYRFGPRQTLVPGPWRRRQWTRRRSPAAVAQWRDRLFPVARARRAMGRRFGAAGTPPPPARRDAQAGRSRSREAAASWPRSAAGLVPNGRNPRRSCSSTAWRCRFRSAAR
jgi:hypothetical protein